jgi:hypothetical protein
MLPRADVVTLLQAGLLGGELVAALRVYADPCNASEDTLCGYEGNLCCRTARDALAKLEIKA